MIRFLSAVATCALLFASPVSAQGVPTVDTRNIAQEIRQLQQMLEDFGIQTDQLDTLLEQLDLVQQQLDTLNETYAALTGATDLSRFRAAPSARLGHFPFEGDRAFPAQC